MLRLFPLITLLSLSALFDPVAGQISDEKVDGYRGIWFDLGQYSEFGSKYSGGLGTYTAKHVPLAHYAKEVNKTFFVYGGTPDGERYLLCMAGSFDHNTGKLSKPTIVHDKGGVDDPHDNPSLAIDQEGFIWVFVSGRGRKRPGYIYKSTKPYSTDWFQRMEEDEITYPQPWWIQDQGFLLLFTKYTQGRELYFQTSPRGRRWSEHTKLAGMGGHYQTSRQKNGKVITAFNRHPEGVVDKRTDLYFVQTEDQGESWQTVDGKSLKLPLKNKRSPALVRAFSDEDRLVYLKDIQFDISGHPVILIITSASHEPGPAAEKGKRNWMIVRWTGEEWTFSEVTEAFHNYDQGSLIIEADNTWRIIAPTQPGPQRYGTGGEVALWTSKDEGNNWKMVRQLTLNSPRNHAYCRSPINAHPDFYAFWADGNPDRLSPSYLYYTNKEGSKVWKMPYDMKEDWAYPIPVSVLAY